MSSPLWLEQLEIGMKWKSQRRTVTETDVVNFACTTGDMNPLHVDRVFASETSFGRPIAHGLLGVSWVAGLGSHSPNVQTLAFVGIKDWRFLKPIFIGDSVHVETEIKEIQPSGRRAGRVFWHRQLVNQDGQVAQEGTFETLVAREQRLRTPPSS